MTTRLAMVLVTPLFFLSTATATLSPSREQTPDLGKKWIDELKQDATRREPKTEQSRNEGLSLSSQTEIKLDGQACRYEQVPGDAQIVLIEVAADRKTIVKIHFQKKK